MKSLISRGGVGGESIEKVTVGRESATDGRALRGPSSDGKEPDRQH